MATNQIVGNRPSLGGMIAQHVIVFLVCIVFPGSTTMVAPATWLTFERVAGDVSCTTRTCVFFIVPFKTQQVSQVSEITHRNRAGRTERVRQAGHTTNKTVHVDGEGFIQVHGADGKIIEVSVSPASLESVVAKAERFLSTEADGSTTLFAIANWKFGALMGGVLTCFTVLYVVGYTLSGLQMIFRFIKKLMIGNRVGPNDNLLS